MYTHTYIHTEGQGETEREINLPIYRDTHLYVQRCNDFGAYIVYKKIKKIFPLG